MPTRFPGRLVALAVVFLTAGAATWQSQARPSRYLYLWAGTGTHKTHGMNVVAVIDANPASPKYGTVIDALTVDTAGMMPHHSEFQLPQNGPLFVNDYMMDRSYLISFADPVHPRLAGRMAAVPHAHTAHSFAHLANGHVLATIQFGDGTVPGDPGGLAEFDTQGKLVRFSSSADAEFATGKIRTYALTTLPAIDRVVTTSSPMNSERTANVVQVWRLSDLKLLKTLSVPESSPDSLHMYPFEVRTLADGRTALMNTYYCGFYRITGLETDPKIERVLAMEHPKNIGCSVPIIAGKFMVMPIAYAHRYATIDISDPSHPVEVASLATDYDILSALDRPRPRQRSRGGDGPGRWSTDGDDRTFRYGYGKAQLGREVQRCGCDQARSELHQCSLAERSDRKGNAARSAVRALIDQLPELDALLALRNG